MASLARVGAVGQIRRRSLLMCGAALVVMLLAAASSASAATSGPCLGSGVLSVSGTTVSCTYPATSNGDFVAPAGVGAVSIIAIGGEGGNGSQWNGTATVCTAPLGGAGGKAQDTLGVASGDLLEIRVGGSGQSVCAGGAGGYDGGGSAASSAPSDYTEGGGGGGASTVTEGTQANPFLIAGGGGGAGNNSESSTGDTAYVSGGAAGYPNGVAGGSYVGGGAGGLGGAGGGGTQIGGGVGGAYGDGCNGNSDAGNGGASLQGGDGGYWYQEGADSTILASGYAAFGSTGAGGGAGYYGGGGASLSYPTFAQGEENACSSATSGAGGGSDFGPSSASFSTSTAGPSVTVSFTAPAPKVTVDCTDTNPNVASSCTATVTGDYVGGAPSGSVSFSSTGTGTFSATSCTLGSATSTSASCGVSYTPHGTAKLTITGSYGGGGIYQAASGSGTLYSVTATATTTKISCTPAEVTAGGKSSCAADVDLNGRRSGYPTGTLAFSTNGAGTLSEKSCTLSGGTYSTGFAECDFSYTTKSAGSDVLTAVYTPSDSTLDGASQGHATVTVDPVAPHPTTTQVSCSATSAGTATSCAADVNLVNEHAGYPGGTLAFSTSGTGTFSERSCTLGGSTHSLGFAECDFTYTPTHSGTDQITATYTPSDSTVWASSAGNGSVAVNSAAASSIEGSFDPAFIKDDGKSTTTVTIVVSDKDGNGVPGEPVKVTTSSTKEKVGTVIDRGDGSYQVTITSSSGAGQATITATDGTLKAVGRLTQYGAATAIGVVLSPALIKDNGTSTTIATVTVTDVKGYGVPGDPVNVTTSASGETVGPVIDHGDGTYQVTITSSTGHGQAAITATDGSLKATAALTQYAAASAVTVSLSPATIVANGTSTTTATVTVKDSKGYGVPGDPVKVTSSSTAETIGAVTDEGNGTYRVTITSSTTAGAFTITAADGSLDGTATLTQTKAM